MGTGLVGRTLGFLWARAGHEVALRSRDLARTAEAAGLAGGACNDAGGGREVRRGGALDATQRDASDLDALAGKVVIDSNNRGPAPDGRYASRPEGPSLAERLQAATPRARVVKRFNTVVMRLLRKEPGRVQALGAQVFLGGDNAKAVVAAPAAKMGLGVVDLGGLAAWIEEALADACRQGKATSPAG